MGYLDTKQKIIETLTGRVAGTQIMPSQHQEFALSLLEYVRSVELISGSTLMGVAERTTVPVQPNTSNAVYIAACPKDDVVTFENFHDADGNAITVDSTSAYSALLIILLWDKSSWSTVTVPTTMMINSTMEEMQQFLSDATSEINTGKETALDDINTLADTRKEELENIGGKAENVTFTPSGALTSTNVQDALTNLAQEASENKDAITESKETVLTPTSTEDGVFYNASGEKKTNEKFGIRKYSIESGKKYKFSGKFPSSTGIYYISYFSGDTFIGNDIYKGSSSETTSYTDATLTIPTGADTIVLNVFLSYYVSGYYNVKSIEQTYIDFNEKFKSYDEKIQSTKDDLETLLTEETDTLSERIQENKDAITESKETVLTPTSTQDGVFIHNGVIKTNTEFGIRKYAIEEGKSYKFSGYFGPNVTIYFISYLSGDTFIGNDIYKGSTTERTTYTDAELTIPSGADTIVMNVNTASSASTNAAEVKSIEQTYIDFDEKFQSFETELKSYDEKIQSTSDDLEALSNDFEKNSCIGESAIPTEIVSGSFVSSGDVKSNSYMSIYKYAVSEGEIYSINCYLPNEYSFYLVSYFDEDGNYISQDKLFRGVVDVSDCTIKIPASATQLWVNVVISQASKYSISKYATKLSATEINEKLESIGDVSALRNAVQKKTYTELTPISTEEGVFYNTSGEKKTNVYFGIRKYSIEEGKEYAFSGRFGNSTQIYHICYFNGDTYLGNDTNYYGSNTTFENAELTIPSGADTIVQSYALAYVGYANVSSVNNEYVSSSDLEDSIKEISKAVNFNNKLMKVTLNASTGDVSIRTNFSSTKDLIIYMHENGNGTMTFNYTQLVGVDEDDSKGVTIHSWSDSTAPIYNTIYAPWHMFAQHGYHIPVVTADVNSIWVDNAGRQYTVGKITSTQLYLLPTVRTTSYDGVYTRDWKCVSNESTTITTLTHVSGAIHTDDIAVKSVSSTQIKPIAESKNRKFLFDGVENNESGTYYCNDFVIMEGTQCFNPFTIDTWFPSPVHNTTMLYINQSFSWHGYSCRYDTMLNVLEPFQFELYGANQGQGLFAIDINDDYYESYVCVPRSKTADVPYISHTGISSKSFLRNTTYLKDKDKCADRTYTFLYNSDNDDKLIGFCCGLSLVKGVTMDSRRNAYMPEGTNTLNVSVENHNKSYFRVIQGSHFANNVMPTTFIENFSTYYTYYNPGDNDNDDCFWYKDTDCYVAYIHTHKANSKKAIKLPKECEGMNATIIESYGNISLLTTAVVDGELYVSTDSVDGNYIVVKLQ